MRFTFFSPVTFALGAAVIAGMLFLLQRLRVRFAELEVVTTLFWREAIEETRARVFVQRFRHPLAYALFLLIAILLWFAAAGPVRSSAGDGRYVLLLDASAGMARSGRFARAIEVLKRRAAELPRSTTSVFVANSRLTTVLEPDEPLQILGRRLLDRSPESCPSTLESAILAIAESEPSPASTPSTTGSDEEPGNALTIEIVGDGPVAESVAKIASSRNRRVFVARVDLDDPSTVAMANAGIIALGVSESLSGAADRVDLYLEVAGVDPGARAPVAVEVDGRPIASDLIGLPARASVTDPARRRFVVRDLPARGGTVEAYLSSATPDGLALDDRAKLVLPNRPPLRVALLALPGDAATAIGSALAADTGIEVVTDAPDVVVRRKGDGGFPGTPALELDEAMTGPAFVVGIERGEAQDVLADSFERLGLRDIDAVALATAAQRPIELSVETAVEHRSVTIWSDLLAATHDFTASRAFPRFVARAMRFLAARPPLVRGVAAGRRLDVEDDGPTSLTFDGRSPFDGVGAAFRVPIAGPLTDSRNQRMHASLLDLATTAGPVEAKDAKKDPGAVGEGAAGNGIATAGLGRDSILTIAILLALLLLAAEWVLTRREAIP